MLHFALFQLFPVIMSAMIRSLNFSVDIARFHSRSALVIAVGIGSIVDVFRLGSEGRPLLVSPSLFSVFPDFDDFPWHQG